jgi:hypothetical protein
MGSASTPVYLDRAAGFDFALVIRPHLPETPEKCAETVVHVGLSDGRPIRASKY